MAMPEQNVCTVAQVDTFCRSLYSSDPKYHIEQSNNLGPSVTVLLQVI